ncbi:PREDICTED: putative FBD-associated F-box protein At5g56390 [Camelina sativa]|uniref:FBD-associated F-box protein At5g56390 n=1 Tax=Camelina sativa TaxID=90675 RepID=A0ABM0WV00_CAMSA|nr:PREDICTED: putative FBD-associated F-box protein At5g56390 [Camelina sativa]
MDMISQLHDELLLGILSLLPTAKDVVATMVLSKRWQSLWMMVPRLVYDDSYQNIDYGKFSTFVDRSLVLHKAPVIETLHFKFGKTCGSTGDTLNRAADKCCVRNLIIEIDTSSTSNTPVTLPRSLYTGGCTRFVTLELSNAVLEDVSSPISFPSLKNLSLIFMKYPGGDEFVKRLLSSCPVLEDLVVERCPDDSVAIFTVRVPCLKNLVLQKTRKVIINESHGFVIDAPSLERLDFADYSCGFCIVENNMCQIARASIDVYSPGTKQLLGSLTSAKRLFLCLTNSKDAYPVGSIFHSLVHLTICICETEWLNVLIRVLRDSANLKTLKIQEYHYIRTSEPRPCWKETSLVPEYLLPSLEKFKWRYYEGTETEKQVVAFILRIASCLKQATIKSSRSINHNKKLEMLKDFPVSSRRSPACLLAFFWTLKL